MKRDVRHIKKIMVVSNTHWDREFRRSFEQTRRRLLSMMDVTLDILEKDSDYASFTLDGHAILLDDYLEMRPERRQLVERLLREGRLIAGPWYTLVEEFAVGHEALVRNFMFGRRTVQKYGGRLTPVAYTPSSWGQTGQLPQILAGFGLKYMMFYRGLSHHECDAEFIWRVPDGTSVLGSRFAIYARYNWYYQVHRPVTVGKAFEKDYVWGRRNEVPLRFADGLAGEDLAFDLKSPKAAYNKRWLKQAILDMIEREGRHFTTPIFLAMHGHDLSVAHPLESRIIKDARQALAGRYKIEHADLETYWREAEKHLVKSPSAVLVGERRSYLKEGMWTYLFPGTISARTYLKQQDFAATSALAQQAEPLASLAAALGAAYPHRYLDRGWGYLLSNHTHDANGGCAPDIVCQDMQYRYRKALDIGAIVSEDAMAHVAVNLDPAGLPADAMQLIVFNPLAQRRDAVALVDLEVPRLCKAQSVCFEAAADKDVPRQPVSCERSGSFVDSIWEVPTILDSVRIKCWAHLRDLPAVGYRVYRIVPDTRELRDPATLVTGPASMANGHIAVSVNPNGTIDLVDKAAGRTYHQLNYLRDQGEAGNAWKHVSPVFDRVFNSLGCTAKIAVIESGPLCSAIEARYEMAVPIDYADGSGRSDIMVDLPVRVVYRLKAAAREVEVSLSVDNRARDHWLRVCMSTGLNTQVSAADSHFDIIERPIPIPDSTGWVERAGGTHPLRTFVSLSDGKAGLALFPRGLFEYEAFDDAPRTLALTLLRACRIKLAVSEEKQAELPDPGVQCPGTQTYEYAIAVHEGDWRSANLANLAAAYAVPLRMVMTGRGEGKLPHELSLLAVQGRGLHMTAVKQAQDGSGMIVRLYNGLDKASKLTLTTGPAMQRAALCQLDESETGDLMLTGDGLKCEVPAKKIVTLKLVPR